MISGLPILYMLIAVVTAIAVVAGGIVLFVIGKGRGALPGAGYLVLGVGVLVTGVLSPLLPSIMASTHLSASAVTAVYGLVTVLFALIGWGLVIAGLFRLRAERPAPPQYGHPPPSPYPPGHDPSGPGWGEPPSGPQGPPPPPGV